MAQIEIKNVIQMAHLANLRAVAGSIPDGHKDIHVIGYIIGRASGVSYRANPNGEAPSIGITGMFEATPTEEGRSVMRAPMVYLPTAFSKMLEMRLKGDKPGVERAPPKGKSIELQGVAEIDLALQIGIRKNSGEGAGYEFSVETLTPDEPTANDALANVRQFLPHTLPTYAALPAPPASAEPKAATKAKGKKK